MEPNRSSSCSSCASADLPTASSFVPLEAASSIRACPPARSSTRAFSSSPLSNCRSSRSRFFREAHRESLHSVRHQCVSVRGRLARPIDEADPICSKRAAHGLLWSAGNSGSRPSTEPARRPASACPLAASPWPVGSARSASSFVVSLPSAIFPLSYRRAAVPARRVAAETCSASALSSSRGRCATHLF